MTMKYTVVRMANDGSPVSDVAEFADWGAALKFCGNMNGDDCPSDCFYEVVAEPEEPEELETFETGEPVHTDADAVSDSDYRIQSENEFLRSMGINPDK